MVLTAVDIDGCAPLVVAVAGQLAADLGEPMTLLYAANLPSSLPGGVVLPGSEASVEERYRAEALTVLGDLAAPWVERGVQVRTEVRFGAPEPVVLGMVEEVAPRFLVMGTHARTGVGRWVFGSVEESITRRSTVPVVVVPAHGTTDHMTGLHRELLAEEDG